MPATLRMTVSFLVFSLAPHIALAQASVSVHLTMGNPSEATTDPANKDDFLMLKREYALSYRDRTATPNWVSWHLTSEMLGNEDRSNDFREDDSLPTGLFRANERSYVGTGLDRGHVCPSGDRTTTHDANSATFLMTNMMPQAPQNNRQTWRKLEEYGRSLAKKGNELYIIAGPTGIGGMGKNGFRSRIANHRITVPSYTWKVILVLRKKDGDDLARVTKITRTIAVIVPNSQAVDTDWMTYRVSVNDVEELTGLNFFSELPDTVEEAIESVVDDTDDE